VTPEDSAWIKAATYTAVAAISGAITSFSLSDWKSRTKFENGLTIFTSIAFAIFFAPWAVHEMFGMDEGTLRTGAFVTYISAAGAPILVPKVIGLFSRMVASIGGEK